ncbi:uncharacterized protein LOC143030459 [Oratosquilla oratoria]|uniref:uncharacterized protein LOC143030459 n=1 Tax=Oratosquilla oratoria TaxID=337810 RepID=UPI003F769A4A
MTTIKEDSSDIVLPNEAVEKISELLESSRLQLNLDSWGHYTPPAEHTTLYNTNDQISSTATGHSSSSSSSSSLTRAPGAKTRQRKKQIPQGYNSQNGAMVRPHFDGLAPLPSTSFHDSLGAPAAAASRTFELSSMTHALPSGVESLESDLSGSASLTSCPGLGPYFNYQVDQESSSSFEEDLSAALPSGLTPHDQYQNNYPTSFLESNTSETVLFPTDPGLYPHYRHPESGSSLEGDLPLSLPPVSGQYLQYRDQDPSSSLDSDLSGSFPLSSGSSHHTLQESTSTPEESFSLASSFNPHEQHEGQGSLSSPAVPTMNQLVQTLPQRQRKPKKNLKNLTAVEKRRHKNELNNESSKVYRDRVRAKMENVEDYRLHLEKENGILRDRVQKLEKELQAWRSMGKLYSIRDPLSKN